jgi:hypothetical protein
MIAPAGNATPGKASPRPTRRKFQYLLVAVLVVIALWTVGWFVANHLASQRIAALKADFIARGGVIGCDAESLGGFPFKFTVDCSPASFDLPERGLSATLGGLEAIALIYNPGHVLTSVQGPLAFKAGNGIGVDANWSSLQTSIRVGTSRLKRFSAVADDLASTITAPVGRTLPSAVGAKHAEVHLIQNGADATALDLSGIVDGLTTTIPGAPNLPSLSAQLFATLPGALPELNDGRIDPIPAWIAAGGKIKLERLGLDVGGFLAMASGDLSVAANGEISGRVAIRIDQLDRLPDLAETLQPGSRDRVARILGPLSAFLQPVQVDGKTWREATLTIRNGKVQAGFIPLGRIPPLKLPNRG